MDYRKFRLETERLLLTAINETFAEEIFKSFSWDIVTYMYPCPADEISGTLSFIADTVEKMKNGEEVVVVILDRETKEFYGCSGIHGISDDFPELGIWTKKEAHGRGYGKETISALYNWGVSQLAKDGFLYPVDRRNVPSRKIPVSLGGSVIKEYYTEGLSGNKLDIVEYRIPAGEIK